MQLGWSRIWTLVAVSISYDDNHYTTATSFLVYGRWFGVKVSDSIVLLTPVNLLETFLYVEVYKRI